jgi:hypothetical protein
MIGLSTTIFKSAGKKLVNLFGSLASRSTYVENVPDSLSEKNHIDDLGVLDKATILLTPTATSDARVHSVKTYTGDELVTNGTFESNVDGWETNNANATFNWQSDKTALFTSTSFAYARLNPSLNLSLGTYKVSFDVLSFEGTLSNVHIGLGSAGNTVTTTGSYTYYTTASGATEFQIRPNSGGTGSIKVDNVSVVDVSSDFDFDRASSATRINSSGLVQDMQSITDPELVLNGDFEELGDELVTNGTFDTDSGWTTLGDWTISGGLASCNGSSIMFTNAGIIANKTYKVTYTVSGFVSGGVKIKINGSPDTDGLVRTSNGTYTEYITSSSSVNGNFSFAAVVSFVGSIDNVSVQQVDPNDRWTTYGDVDFDDGKATVNIVGGGLAYVGQSYSFINGNTYKLNFTVNGTSEKQMRVQDNGSNTGGLTLADGTITLNGSDQDIEFIWTANANSNNLVFTRSTNTGDWSFSIDNVSVKDITFSTDVDLARINYDSNGDNGHILLEPTSTNLITYSENFEGGSWTNESIGTTPTLEGGYTAPDGSNSAYKISNANQDSFWYYPSVADSDDSRTIWARTVSGTGTAQLTSHNSNTNNTFNLTETWQRFEVNSTTSSTGQTSFYAVDFRGSGTLTELLLWGAQLEDLPYATSYIPTLTGSTVTRATETLTGSGNSTLINSTEGVLYAEIAALADDGIAREITLNDGTEDNRVIVSYNTSSQIRINYRKSGSNIFDQTHATTTTDYNKIAIKWELNSFRFYVNGTQIASSSSGAVMSANTLNTIDFDNYTGSFKFNGKCKALAVFNEALSDDELELLTGVTNYGSFGALATANGYTII